MLQILITNILLLIINFGSGVLLSGILKVKIRRISMVSLLGMAGIACFQTLAAFFFPLDSVLEMCIAAVGLIGFLMFLKNKTWKIFVVRKNMNLWFYFFLVIILFTASFAPYFYDHYSYYLPTISYLKDFGFIKGVANVDLLLGQASFWHIYQAGFSNIIDVDLRINSFVLILFLIYIYESRRMALVLLLPFFLIFLQQPSPDLPALILTLVVINELIGGRNNGLVLILSLFAVCIKPVVFWLPLLVILESLYTRSFRLKSVTPVLLFGFLLMIKNIWLFGFPIFPTALFDFDFSWRPSPEILTYSSQVGWMKSYDMQYSFQQLSAFDHWGRMFHWFTIGNKSIFNYLIIFCLVVLAWLSFRKQDKIYTLIFLCFLLKFIIIALFSAQYRFFLDLYLVTIFLWIKNMNDGKAVFIAMCMSAFILLIFSVPGAVKDRLMVGKWLTGLQLSQFYKPAFSKEVKIYKQETVGNFNFNASENPFSKDRFPSLSLYDLKLYNYYGIIPQQDGNGFVQRKMTPKEKLQLQQIMDDLKKSQK